MSATKRTKTNFFISNNSVDFYAAKKEDIHRIDNFIRQKDGIIEIIMHRF
jgi:hypothetical protein